MTIERASDNPFPSILIAEATEPTAPAAGHQRLYVDSTTHVLMITNSSGTQTPVSSSGLSDPMTTRGDLIIRNASNVTARLGRGSANQVLTSDGTDIAWATGGGTVPKELGYAQITTSFTTTSSSATDVTSLSVTVTIGSLPVIVSFGCSEMRNSVAGSRALADIYDSTAAAEVYSGIIVVGNSADAGVPVYAQVRLSPSSGSRTYKVQLKCADATGTSAIRAGSTNPAFIRVHEYTT